MGPDNCQLNSKVDADTGKILFTGFTNSSGIQEVLKIISHSSGFRPISMDKAGVDCIANETLFVHSTLPNSISRCPIRDTVIMLCNPQEIIRNSDKNQQDQFWRGCKELAENYQQQKILQSNENVFLSELDGNI